MIEAAAIIVAVRDSAVDYTLCPACLGDCIEQEEACCGQPYRDGTCCGRAYPPMVTTWVCAVCDGGRSPRCEPVSQHFPREQFTADDLDAEIPF